MIANTIRPITNIAKAIFVPFSSLDIVSPSGTTDRVRTCYLTVKSGVLIHMSFGGMEIAERIELSYAVLQTAA